MFPSISLFYFYVYLPFSDGNTIRDTLLHDRYKRNLKKKKKKGSSHLYFWWLHPFFPAWTRHGATFLSRRTRNFFFLFYVRRAGVDGYFVCFFVPPVLAGRSERFFIIKWREKTTKKKKSVSDGRRLPKTLWGRSHWGTLTILLLLCGGGGRRRWGEGRWPRPLTPNSPSPVCLLFAALHKQTNC